MRRVALLAVLLVLSGCATGVDPGNSDPGSGMAGMEADLTGRVTEVVDGDTVKVQLGNGTRETVRLVGVDTPEVHSETTPDEFEGVPDTEAGRACLRRWGKHASELATSELAGQRIGLVFDPNLDRRGYYGRLLAYVVVDDGTFNYRLVETGHARVYDSDFARKNRYLGTERRARADGTGLWVCATDSPPTASQPTAIADGGTALSVSASPDAPGNDNDNLNEETVSIHNGGETTVDLSGWTVTDEAGHEYTFGDVTLDAGYTVTLHTGSGTATATDVYWGRSSAVWNNDGDTVTIRDASGAVVVQTGY